jgi:hypothetical protein
MADIRVAVVRVAIANTGTTTASVTGFGTPKAAIVISTLADTDGTARNGNTSFSIGFTDGTNHRCVQIFNEDGVAGTSADRSRHARSDMLGFTGVAAGNNTSFEILFNAFVTDGIEFTVDEGGGGADRSALVILFGGADLQAQCGTFTLSNLQDTTASVTDISFNGQPQVVFFLGDGDTSFVTSDTTGLPHSIITFGVAQQDSEGTITQHCSMWASTDVAATTQNNSYLSTTRCAGQVFSDALSYTAEVTDFLSNGFTVATRDGASANDVLGYLAFYLGGAKTKILTLATPTTPSIGTYTTDFKPQAVVIGANSISTADSLGTSATGVEGYGVSAFDASRQGSIEFTCDDGVATSNESQLVDAKAFRVGSAGAPHNVVAIAEFDSFNADNFKLNFTSAPAASRNSWAIAFQAAVHVLNKHPRNRSIKTLSRR